MACDAMPCVPWQAAIANLAGEAGLNASRTVDIMSDAAHWILTQPGRRVSGRCFIDEDIITDSGDSIA
jgi:citronellol/citronellal dehydrogenase